MNIEVKSTVKYREWNVPNFAVKDDAFYTKKDGLQPHMPPIPVIELDPEVVDALAGAWLDALYTKVGRSNPFVLKGTI